MLAPLAPASGAAAGVPPATMLVPLAGGEAPAAPTVPAGECVLSRALVPLRLPTWQAIAPPPYSAAGIGRWPSSRGAAGGGGGVSEPAAKIPDPPEGGAVPLRRYAVGVTTITGADVEAPGLAEGPPASEVVAVPQAEVMDVAEEPAADEVALAAARLAKMFAPRGPTEGEVVAEMAAGIDGLGGADEFEKRTKAARTAAQALAAALRKGGLAADTEATEVAVAAVFATVRTMLVAHLTRAYVEHAVVADDNRATHSDVWANLTTRYVEGAVRAKAAAPAGRREPVDSREGDGLSLAVMASISQRSAKKRPGAPALTVEMAQARLKMSRGYQGGGVDEWAAEGGQFVLAAPGVEACGAKLLHPATQPIYEAVKGDDRYCLCQTCVQGCGRCLVCYVAGAVQGRVWVEPADGRLLYAALRADADEGKEGAVGCPLRSCTVRVDRRPAPQIPRARRPASQRRRRCPVRRRSTRAPTSSGATAATPCPPSRPRWAPRPTSGCSRPSARALAWWCCPRRRRASV